MRRSGLDPPCRRRRVPERQRRRRCSPLRGAAAAQRSDVGVNLHLHQMADATLYLFDGYNLLHAGSFADARELVDQLASFVALRGARGVVVFDGVGEARTHGPLEVRFAPHADAVLERLAAEHRLTEQVMLISSDAAV